MTGIMKSGWKRGRCPVGREMTAGDRELPHISGNVALTSCLSFLDDLSDTESAEKSRLAYLSPF